jgi:hypothetical protein
MPALLVTGVRDMRFYGNCALAPGMRAHSCSGLRHCCATERRQGGCSRSSLFWGRAPRVCEAVREQSQVGRAPSAHAITESCSDVVTVLWAPMQRPPAASHLVDGGAWLNAGCRHAERARASRFAINRPDTYVHDGYKWARRNATFCLAPSGVRCHHILTACNRCTACNAGSFACVDEHIKS